MESAEQRKQRLKAMRQAAEAVEGDDAPTAMDHQPTDAPADAENGGAPPTLKFRNYALRDEKIDHEKVAPAKAPEFAEPEKPPPDAADEDVLATLAPKKANWDLKREIAPKLEKLERRTQRAMIQLLQQEEARRQAEGGE